MRFPSTLVALLLTTGLAHAQAVSPLGGSTNNAGSPPPALATKPAAPATAAPATPSPTTAAPATTAPTTAAPAATAPVTHARRTYDERFAAANTTHDGKLTLEQARAGHLRSVVRDFAKIDKTKKGYVTLDEIKAHQAELRAAHRAAKKPAQ